MTLAAHMTNPVKWIFLVQKNLFEGHLTPVVDSTGQTMYYTIVPAYGSLLDQIYGTGN
jgi:hypothetical protein